MKKLILGISIGDINGIGPEVLLKALNKKGVLKHFTPVIYAHNKIISFHRKLAGLQSLRYNTIQQINQAKSGQINVLECWDEDHKIQLGQVNQIGGQCAINSLNAAMHDLKKKNISGLVTAPIHKKAMQIAGFEHTGHTEWLTSNFEGAKSLMVLVNDDLRVSLVTNHLPIHAVAKTITEELVLSKINTFDYALKRDFSIDKPKIAVLGLNPHASDEGLIGNEEKTKIIPAINQAREKGLLAMGPFPADGFFGKGQFKKFDGVLAMYHDQGLVPFKAMSFGAGVNFTAGLPIVRTSPDHGTAMDIAGKNLADAGSIIQAIYAALDIIRSRNAFDDMHKSPLIKKDVKPEN